METDKTKGANSWLTYSQAAEFAGVTTESIRLWVRDKKVRMEVILGEKMVSKQSLKAQIARRACKGGRKS